VIANQPTSRLFVEWAKLRQEPDGTCLVVIEPVYGEIKASISFLGHVWAVTAMDGEMKLWHAGFRKTTTHKSFGGTAFKSQEQAMEFVARFIELGCPEPGSILWGLFMGEFQGRQKPAELATSTRLAQFRLPCRSILDFARLTALWLHSFRRQAEDKNAEAKRE
jgi:hypothetical protein